MSQLEQARRELGAAREAIGRIAHRLSEQLASLERDTCPACGERLSRGRCRKCRKRPGSSHRSHS